MKWKPRRRRRCRPSATNAILVAGFRDVTRLLRLILAAIKEDNTPPARVPTSFSLSVSGQQAE